jgi:hypothetical protein
MKVQKTQKRLLQKISKVTGILSTLTAIICAIYLFIIRDSGDDVLRASIGATAFFFFMVGLVLNTMADTDIPNLKIEDK